MQPHEAKELAKSRKGNAGVQHPRELRKPEHHETREHHDHESHGHDTHTVAAGKPRAPRKARNDSFAVSFRVPAKYEFAVFNEAYRAKSAGEFVPHENKREMKGAYIEHIVMAFLDELLERHPLPEHHKGR